MDQDAELRYRRWLEAEDGGRDADADAACMALFSEVPRRASLSPDFTAGTLHAVAAAMERDRRRLRWVRRGALATGAGAAVALVYAGGGWILWAASSLLVGLVDLLVSLTVRVANGLQTGADVWTVMASLGHAAADLVANPKVTVAMLAIQGIAMLALIALQRLLGSDRESLK